MLLASYSVPSPNISPSPTSRILSKPCLPLAAMSRVVVFIVSPLYFPSPAPSNNHLLSSNAPNRVIANLQKRRAPIPIPDFRPTISAYFCIGFTAFLAYRIVTLFAGFNLDDCNQTTHTAPLSLF